MTRSLRRWVSLLCVAGFAFAQFAIAANACPLRAPVAPVSAVAQPNGYTNSCPGHAGPGTPDQGPLCEVHCDGQTGVTGSASLVVPPLVLAPFPVALPSAPDPVAIARIGRTPRDANAAAPPVAHRFCRLLI